MTPSRDSLPLPDPSSQPIHDVISGILRRLAEAERGASDNLNRIVDLELRVARMEGYFCKCCWSAPHKHGSDLCRDCERQEYADLKSPPDEAGGEGGEE